MILFLKKYREMVFQLLFSIDGGAPSEKDLIPFFMDTLSISHKHVHAAYQRALEIWEKKDVLDQKIEKMLLSCPMDQVSDVDKNILRMSLWEMVVEKEVAPKIVIVEAVRLCRKFSTPKGGALVNAVLDTYYERAHDEKPGSALSSSERATS